VVSAGTVSCFVIERGGRLALRVRDTASPRRTGFAGIDSFPEDAAWRIEAVWEAFAEPRELQVTNVLGQVTPEKAPGRAVFQRDHYACQYCGGGYPTPDLTFDHVIPRSRGGRTSWDNVVTACGPCNLRKGNRLPRECQMIPRQTPRQPTSWELQENGRSCPPNYLHESWRDYLYWDSELEN
jgi:hypothetical protein